MVLLHIFQGVQLFPGGGGGVQMLISIETHTTITCDFPGGSSIPPLDPTHRHRGILARIGSDEPVRPLLSLKTPTNKGSDQTAHMRRLV